MHHVILYAIPQCDTVKKARLWLSERGISYQFYDYKRQSFPADRWDVWTQRIGRDRLINRQGTTWRKLAASDQDKALASDEAALELALAQPSVIKRPVVEWSNASGLHVSVGFTPELWERWHLETGD
ncbi:Spx/MgsR family RNA polymerase-binding regulatory protein [Acidovorax lacteus]|uniref:ArsC family reductase n=1 Tax=Acidovorax lacteus TaxID=1924988 RepID=A0ABP8L5U5_9BURK